MIWLIGGTSDAEDIGRTLLVAGAKIVVTTAARTGEDQMHVAGVPCVTMPVDCVEMIGFIMVRSIVLIIDASHPFAAKVSKSAISASMQCGIPYIRYDRSASLPECQLRPLPGYRFYARCSSGVCES